MSDVDALVRAVLYEGYTLYPYRPSALKNQRRFAFGAVYPRAWAQGASEPFTLRAEGVFEGRDAAAVAIAVRFLLLGRGGGGDEHAIELDRPISDRFTRGPVQIEIDARVESAGPSLFRVAVELANVTAVDPTIDREAAMDLTLASTHVVIRAPGARAISAIDPPPHAAAAIAATRTLGCYPVVAAVDTVLASPIVLPDFPQLAPTSPGDFFDGTEMDEMLTLRVLTLTADEKREAAAADPRIAALLARTEALGIAETAHLHGLTALGAGVDIRIGTRVVVHPRGRADAFDLLLDGRTATVAKVDRDLEGRLHCGVVFDDDPGRDLGEAGLPGHRFFFAPDELEVIA